MFPINKLKLEKLSVKPVTVSGISVSENTEDDLNSTLLKSLRCTASSCHRYLYSPIRQCRSGHCLCFKCSESPRRICPECGTPIIEARNLALEAISEKLIISCKYRSDGCLETMPKGHSMVAHEQQCQFRMYKCFAGKCTWSGHVHNILTHMESHHRERVFLGTEKAFKIKKLENRDDMDMMFLFSSQIGEFWVKLIYKKIDNAFFGAVQYIGNTDWASDYTYCFEMKASDDDSEKCYKYTRKTHVDITNFEIIFKSRDCFWAPINFAKYLGENDVLSVTLNIEYIGNR